ncbi:MAG: hypothetical protein UW15_C0018G0004 [Parcubacteria group bacterium GW2011_GWC1_44_10]|uniref:DNA methylase N-4/N-6 domain-containing protein n=1 Tax=Candidatus Giovannonibacteria bacterium GW2011_GWA1_44_25 TaxID=1618645 RepID=A0A0G1IKC8_9BACT|nr:MAG: hypothetical protein US07_C0005G0010 [Candidatus Levybacteria bacterium GW2011_GWB1_36_18]KKT29091.1 MAG: hypothetical protein UW15_C0018G0004 [Parcubacteria group bacterium GW2011_GWC1_44_10]KKT59338.1 MAG: hypothetical protein UW53_C0015G0021 [Candidatus Giovannonibacteria bacterium GW2011_GWA1_44_25]
MPKKLQLQKADLTAESFSTQNLLKETEGSKKKIKKSKPIKKYGLVWDSEKEPELVVELCKEQLPVLEEDSSKEIKTEKEKPINILIEGDNYHALSVLNYTHKGKVDVIYIDPPYNTGNKDFIYNDKYVDKEDAYRHSKWLSFMEKRLKLAKNLLKKTGAIFISIDDNELAQLKLLCDEVFGENSLIGIVTVGKGTTTGQDAKRFGSSADYLLVYGMVDFQLGKIAMSEKDKKRFSKKDEKGNYSTLQFRKTGNNDKRANRPNLFYALKDPDGNDVYPLGPSGYESTWRGDTKYFQRLERENMIEWIKQGRGWRPYVKFYLEGRGKSASNLWVDIEGNKKATIELKEFFGERVFSNPKPTDLIKRCITLANVISPLVLDFFAGSGTSAQAVLALNSQDDEDRRFILCTNNENNICTDICYPRIEKVINGYKSSKNEKVIGISSNLKYFKTDFIKGEATDKNKKMLVDKSAEMLCLKEDCFELVKKDKYFKIFKNYQNKYLGIVYDDDAIAGFKKEAKRLNKKIIVYIFSLDESAREEEFEDIKSLVQLKPIPTAILSVYKRIFK